MAFTAREVIMTFRGQNYLSGAIRRVGRDVGALSRQQQLAVQRSQLVVNQRRLAQSRAIAQAELTSLRTGSRSLAMDMRKAGLKRGEIQSNLTLRNTLNEQRLNVEKQLATTTRLQQIQAVAARRKVRGQPLQLTPVIPPSASKAMRADIERAISKVPVYYRPGSRAGPTLRALPKDLTRMTPQQLSAAYTAAAIDAQRLEKRTSDLITKEQKNKLAIDSQSIASRKYAAQIMEQAAREDVLTAATETNTLAQEKQALAMKQNALEMRMLPWEKWKSGAANIEHAGRVLQMFGLISTAATGYFALSSAKFAQQATLAATQARPPNAPIGATAQKATEVTQGTLNLMRQFPAAAEEMNQSWYEIFSGTNIQQTEKAADVMKVFNMMAVAGSADLKTVTDAGLTMYNVFGTEFPNMTEAGNAFFAMVRYGRGNVDQFARALPFVAGIAKEVGNSFYDVGEALAFVSRQTGGRYLTRDAQGLARLYQMLAKPAVIQGLKQQGIAVADASGNMRPLLEIMTQISDKIKPTGISAINFFKTISAAAGTAGTTGTIQAQRVFAFMMNNMEQYTHVAKLVRADNDELIKSFEAMRKTPGVRWDIFINQLKVLIYQIGSRAIPAFIKLGQPIGRLIRWFDGLSNSSQKLISNLLAFGSVGLLLAGTLAALFGGLARIGITLAMFIKFRGEVKALAAEMVTLAQRAEGIAPAIASSGIINPRTGQAFAAAGAAAGAAGAGEVGASTPIGAIKMFSIVGPIGGLMLFHKQVMQVVNALGGLRGVIAAVTVALTVFTVARTISAMYDLVIAAEAAGKAVSLLRLSLLAINGFVAIATLVFLYKRGTLKPFIDNFKAEVDSKLNAARNWMTKYSGMHWIGNLLGNPKGMGEYTDTRTPNEKQVDASNAAIQQAIKDSPRYQHAIQANQAALNGEYNAQVKAAAERQRRGKLDAVANVTSHAGTRNVQEWITAIQQARAAMLGNTHDVAAAKRYETLVDALNKRFKSQPALLAAINDVLQSYDSNLKQAANDTKKLQTSFEDVLGNVKQMYQSFLQQEQSNFGQLFQGPYMQGPEMQNYIQWGGLPTGKDYLKDYKSQITQYKEFNNLLAGLAKRGAPAEYINQLRSMGPAQIEAIRAISKLTKPELDNLFGMFRTAQRLVHQQTLRDLTAQLQDYKKYGRNVALQMAAGITETPAITNAIKAAIANAFGAIPTQAQLDATTTGNVGTKVPGGKTKIQTGLGTTQAEINARMKILSRGTTNDWSWQNIYIPNIPISKQPHVEPGFIPYKPPGRATGGIAERDRPYIVGEKGPELFVPKHTGTVLPHHVTKYIGPRAAPLPTNFKSHHIAQLAGTATQLAAAKKIRRSQEEYANILNPFSPRNRMDIVKTADSILLGGLGTAIKNRNAGQAALSAAMFLPVGRAGRLGRAAGLGRLLRDETGSIRLGRALPAPGHEKQAAHFHALLEKAAKEDEAITRAIRSGGTGRGRSVLAFMNEPMSAAEKAATKAPGVWYHGTKAVFDRFKISQADPEGLYGPGHYFTNDSHIASGYAKTAHYGPEVASNVKMARLMVKRPFNLEGIPKKETWEALESTLTETMNMPGFARLGVAGKSYKASRVIAGHRFSQYELEAVIQDMAFGATKGRYQRWSSNHRLYAMLERYMGSKAGANKLLQKAGFDAITHTGGKITGSAPHKVMIVFSGAQVRPHYMRGGRIPGIPGMPVDLTAHAGEMILNTNQQRKLAQMVFGQRTSPMVSHPMSTNTTNNDNSKKEDHVHYHIETPKSEQASVKAQIRHADFVRRNRYRS